MPAWLSNLKRALTALGLSVTVTEISDTYMRGVCRAFNLDESELRKLL